VDRNQIVQAFSWESAPHHLLRDRDGIYGDRFRHRIEHLSINEVIIARSSPWQKSSSFQSLAVCIIDVRRAA
jgi:hypothetical protein